MSKIIDLSILEKEPLIFKGTNGDVFTIPGNISTKFTIKLSHYHQEIGNIQGDEQALNKMKAIVVDILNLDKSKNIDITYVEENFDDVRILSLIISEMNKHIYEIANDPNSPSLSSIQMDK